MIRKNALSFSSFRNKEKSLNSSIPTFVQSRNRRSCCFNLDLGSQTIVTSNILLYSSTILDNDIPIRALHGMGPGVRDHGTRIPRDPRESQLKSGPGSGRERDPRPADGMGWESHLPSPHGMGRDGLNHGGSDSRTYPVTI